MSGSFTVDAQFTVCMLVTLYMRGQFINNIDKRLMYNCCSFQGLCVCRWWAGGGCGSPQVVWCGVQVGCHPLMSLKDAWGRLSDGAGVPTGPKAGRFGVACPGRAGGTWKEIPVLCVNTPSHQGPVILSPRVFKDSPRQAYIISQLLSLLLLLF